MMYDHVVTYWVYATNSQVTVPLAFWKTRRGSLFMGWLTAVPTLNAGAINQAQSTVMNKIAPE